MNQTPEITLIRGDHRVLSFDFDPGTLTDVARATFTMTHLAGASVVVAAPIDGDTATVSLTPAETALAGGYRADLRLIYRDGTIHTPWLAGNFGDILIIDNVTR
jgi:hypothetical protein